MKNLIENMQCVKVPDTENKDEVGNGEFPLIDMFLNPKKKKEKDKLEIFLRLLFQIDFCLQCFVKTSPTCFA